MAVFEDVLSLMHGLEFAIDVNGLAAAGGADNALGFPIHHDDEARLIELLAGAVLFAPAHGSVNLVIAEDKLTGEGSREIDGLQITAVESEALELTLAA